MLSFFLRLPARWPHVVMLTVAAVWGIVAFLTAPLFEVVYVTSGRGVVILGGYVLAFILGSWAVSVVHQTSTSTAAQRPAAPRGGLDMRFAFVGATICALAGILLRLYDRLILRGAELGLAEIARRKIDVALTANESPIGLIAAPLTGFCFMPAMLVLLNPKLTSKPIRYMAFAIALFPPFEAVYFQGGTSVVALALLLLLSVLATRPTPPQPAQKKTRHLSFPQQIGLIAAGGSALVLGGWMFTARVHAIAGSVSQYLIYAAGSNANVVVPSQLALRIMDVPVFGQIAFVIYWISLYVTSGVYNLFYVLERGFIFHTHGATQTQVFLRAFDILTGNGTRPSVADSNPLAGLYQTMFGDVYLDFGVIGGLVQCLLMGVIAALVHRARLKGNSAAQMIDPILKTFLLMGVFVSSLSSFGLFVLLAAFALILLAAFSPRPRGNIVMPVPRRAS
jgi:hypothetical protein